jgi:hypothetical protein
MWPFAHAGHYTFLHVIRERFYLGSDMLLMQPSQGEEKSNKMPNTAISGK